MLAARATHGGTPPCYVVSLYEKKTRAAPSTAAVLANQQSNPYVPRPPAAGAVPPHPRFRRSQAVRGWPLLVELAHVLDRLGAHRPEICTSHHSSCDARRAGNRLQSTQVIRGLHHASPPHPVRRPRFVGFVGVGRASTSTPPSKDLIHSSTRAACSSGVIFFSLSFDALSFDALSFDALECVATAAACTDEECTSRGSTDAAAALGRPHTGHQRCPATAGLPQIC